MTDTQFRQILREELKPLKQELSDDLRQTFKDDLRQTLKHELNLELNTQLAIFYGQVTRHFDKKINTVQAEFRSDVDRMYSLLDGLALRITDDESERAAMGHEQIRHKRWIGQLAKRTDTKLVPEFL